MQTVLIAIHLLVVLALVGVVLLQKSEGGALGTGGGGGFMTGRGQANALSRATAILAAMFFATSLAMSMLASWSRAPRSIIESAPASTSAPAVPGQSGAPAGSAAPQKGNLLDQLKKLDKDAPAAPAPAEPVK